MEKDKLHIGTISWKYDSWQGIVYPESKPFNHLREYSRHYRTVEVDQWFWSLFSGDKAALPKSPVVEEYAGSVPGDFTFGIKVPNSITLTHHYKKKKSDPLIPNPYFLSIHLMQKFLERLAPLSRNIGPLIFQFEYLNKQKMPGKLQQFIDQFGEFAEQLPGSYKYCVEIRNPNYLDEDYFEFLNERKLHHVFLQGHYMPSIFELYNKHREQIKNLAVIRLHGSDQKEVEVRTGKKWSMIVSPKDSDIESLAGMLEDMERRGIETFVYVKNQFEGSAPMTIARIENRLSEATSFRA
jgi:uncharacterized protein YecE (DUF72 family)